MSYQPKVHRKQGGDEIVVASGGKVTVQSGGEVDVSSGTLKLPSSTLGKGFIPIPLAGLRKIGSNDIINLAGTGGILAKDSTPILERVNAATDKKLRVKWAAGNTDELTFDFAYPPDLDDTAAIVVNFLAKMGGTMDTPTITVGYFEGIGDTDAGGATGALSDTLAKVTRTIAAGDVGAYPAAASVSIAPGAHANDTVEIYGIWIEYTRKAS